MISQVNQIKLALNNEPSLKNNAKNQELQQNINKIEEIEKAEENKQKKVMKAPITLDIQLDQEEETITQPKPAQPLKPHYELAPQK